MKSGQILSCSVYTAGSIFPAVSVWRYEHRACSCIQRNYTFTEPECEGKVAAIIKTGMNIHGLSEENSVILKIYKFCEELFGFFVDYL